MQILQTQTNANKTELYRFGQTISERIKKDPLDFYCTLFSDETHFHLRGHVNKQNFWFWVSKQPHEHVEKPLKCRKNNGMVCTWNGLYFWIILFKDDDGFQVTVNADQYTEMLQRCLIPALKQRKCF